MGFRINTNIAAMNAHANSVLNNKELDNSLAMLSSGLRINTAADDASGLMIADSLKSQSNSLGQAIKNANDAIGMVKIADKAMDTQIKILDSIKTKATQAAADGQSLASRQAIQNDISKLLEELDNIANTTSYNGLNLLSGSFTNKEFQIGAYSRETINISIDDTTSAKIGSTRFETTKSISSSADLGASSNFIHITRNGMTTTIAGVKISNTAGTGIGALAEAINKASDITGVRAKAMVQTTGSAAVAAGSLSGLSINGIILGDIKDIKANDSDGKLTNTINMASMQTGVVASIDGQGRMNLTSVDGRGIEVLTGASSATVPVAGTTTPHTASVDTSVSNTITVGSTGTISNFKIGGGTVSVPGSFDLSNGGGPALASALDSAIDTMTASSNFNVTYSGGVLSIVSIGPTIIDNWSWDATSASTSNTTSVQGGLGSLNMGISVVNGRNYGRLSLVAYGANDIIISSAALGGSVFANSYESTINLRSVNNPIISNSALAIGAYANNAQSAGATVSIGMGVGVTTRAGAMMVMSIAESAIKQLDKIRASLGSTQNQLAYTIENISITQVNVSAAESQIRDVDFAEESANFSKRNILSQAGSYAMSQANAIQQNILRLLQ